MSVDLSPTLSLPVEAVTQTFAILGKRGRGKTNTAVVLAEELIGSGLPVAVVDTVGAWWGLRSSADGTKPGLPVVVFGGDHGDVPLAEDSGKIIADAILEHRIPAVIDTSILSKGGARRFLTAFVTQVYHRNREPLHVIFDEADELAPQRPGTDGIKLLGAMEDFVRRGRLRGLGCTLVTQRPAVLHKDVLTQAEVLISMGMTGPRDVAAINEWVQLHADDGEAKTVRDSLASLPVGTGWVWSPEWLGILQRVEFRERTTFDSSATPKVGQIRVTPTERAPIDLAQLGEQISAMAEKAKADDPKTLRARITVLEKQLRSQPVLEPTTVVETVPVITDEQLTELNSISEQMAIAASTMSEALRSFGKPSRILLESTPRPKPTRRPEDPADAKAVTLGRPARTVLTVLATYGARTQIQLAILTGYSSKSGSFRNTLSMLRTAGLILGGKDSIDITPDGIRELGDFEPLPSGPGLIDHWMRQVGGPHRAILTALLDVWPKPLTHEQVAEATGYQPTSGSFRNSLSKLRTLELIHGGRDAIFVSDTLGEAA